MDSVMELRTQSIQDLVRMCFGSVSNKGKSLQIAYTNPI